MFVRTRPLHRRSGRRQRIRDRLRSVARCGVLAVATAFAFPPQSALAQEAYPTKVVRIVVPFPAGGAMDVMARLLQPHFEKSLGQPVIVENRPGATGALGAAHVAKAEPDGHTLLVTPSEYAVNAATAANLPYDSERDLIPVSLIAINHLMFLTNPQVPARSLAEFVQLAKAQPGKLNYATPGATSQARLLIEMFAMQAGIKLTHVPYRGGPAALMGTVSNDAQLALIAPISALPHLENGKLRGLATGGTSRHPQLPDVPTVAESGYPGFEAIQWIGLMTTAGTSEKIIQRLNQETNNALRQPDVTERLRQLTSQPGGGTPEQFRTVIARDIRNYKDIAAKANIRAE